MKICYFYPIKNISGCKQRLRFLSTHCNMFPSNIFLNNLICIVRCQSKFFKLIIIFSSELTFCDFVLHLYRSNEYFCHVFVYWGWKNKFTLFFLSFDSELLEIFNKLIFSLASSYTSVLFFRNLLIRLFCENYWKLAVFEFLEKIFVLKMKLSFDYKIFLCKTLLKSLF